MRERKFSCHIATTSLEAPPVSSTGKLGHLLPWSELLVFNWGAVVVRKPQQGQRLGRGVAARERTLSHSASPQTISREEIGRVRITELCD